MKNKFSRFLVGIATTIFLVCIGVIAYDYVRLQSYNQIPLTIHTFDGSDSPYHPSVIYSETGWNGYHYMMSETPFYKSLPTTGENYIDQYELPSIHYSDDGVQWTKCDNPLDTLSLLQKKNRDYYSDPELIVTPLGIECWYRLNRRYGKETNQRNIVLFRKVTQDGINWGERQLIADLENGDFDDVLGHIVICPTVVYDEGKYKMWFVSDGGTHNGVLGYSETDSTLASWTKKIPVILNGQEINPWHQHILKDGDVYWLTIYDHSRNITIWKSENGTAFDYVSTPLVSSSAIGSFYSNDLYRACLFKEPNRGGYRLYFSADDMFKSYIGIMEGDTPWTLKVVSAGNGVHTSFIQFVRLYCKTYYTRWSRKAKYYSHRLIEKPKELFYGK